MIKILLWYIPAGLIASHIFKKMRAVRTKRKEEYIFKNVTNMSLFKACVRYFLPNFYFQLNDGLSKTMKIFFYLYI